MKKLLCLLSVAAAFAITACSGPRYSIDPNWKEKPKSFTVVISEPYVQNQDDVEDDIPEYATHFADWLAQQMQMEFELRTKIKPEIKVTKDEYFDPAILPLDKNKMIKAHLPNTLRIDGLQGVIIAIHPIRFRRAVDPCPQGGCLNNKYLRAHADYSFSDVSKRQILGYGFVGVQDSFSFAMTKGNWENVVKDMVKKILEETPLE